MFTTIEHFEKTWTQEMLFSQSVMDTLTDASLNQAVADGHRTLGQMAWHIVTTIPEMAGLIGLQLDAPDHTAPVPRTAPEIQQAYREASGGLLNAVKSQWDDASLQTEDDLWGEKWRRGKTLQIFLAHEIHHRGQMTVLMRQAGLKVPDLYGPAKES